MDSILLLIFFTKFFILWYCFRFLSSGYIVSYTKVKIIYLSISSYNLWYNILSYKMSSLALYIKFGFVELLALINLPFSTSWKDTVFFIITHWMKPQTGIIQTFFPKSAFNLREQEVKLSLRISLQLIGHNSHFQPVRSSQISSKRAFTIQWMPVYP